jgi:hypothetical protein
MQRNTMHKKLVSFLFILIFTFSVLALINAQTDYSKTLKLNILTDADEYPLLSNVKILIALFNLSNETLKLEFQNSLTFDFQIRGLDNNYTYEYSKNVPILWFNREIVLKAYENIAETFYWNATIPGKFLIYAYLVNHPEVYSQKMITVLPFTLKLQLNKPIYKEGEDVFLNVTLIGQNLKNVYNSSLYISLEGALTGYHDEKKFSFFIRGENILRNFNLKYSNLKPDSYKVYSIFVFDESKIINSLDFFVIKKPILKIENINIFTMSNYYTDENMGYIYIVLKSNLTIYDFLVLSLFKNSTFSYFEVSKVNHPLNLNLEEGKYLAITLLYKLLNPSNFDLSSLNLSEASKYPFEIDYAGYAEFYVNSTTKNVTLQLKPVSDFTSKQVQIFINASNLARIHHLFIFNLIQWNRMLIDLQVSSISISLDSFPTLFVVFEGNISLETISLNKSIEALGVSLISGNQSSVSINMQNLSAELPQTFREFILQAITKVPFIQPTITITTTSLRTILEYYATSGAQVQYTNLFSSQLRNLLLSIVLASGIAITIWVIIRMKTK